jgi:hypothetical protein
MFKNADIGQFSIADIALILAILWLFNWLFPELSALLSVNYEDYY